MNKKQKLILIFIVLTFLGLTSFLLIKNKQKESKYLYLFTGDYSIVRWYYNNDTWYIANTNEKLNDKFNLYSNGVYQGKYNLVFNDKWYYFDSENKSKKFEGLNFMINTNYEFNSYEFKTDYINDNRLSREVAKMTGITNSDYDSNIKKVKIFDNDEFDYLYFVDYYKRETEFNVLGPSYTVAFIEKNDTIDIVKMLSFDEKDNDSCSLNMVGMFKFANEHNKLLLNCIHFDRIPSDYYLYEFKWNKYNLLIEGNGGV